MGKITHEMFVNRVVNGNQHVRNGEIEILGQYVASNIPVQCRCNIHNKIWNAHPVNLYNGCGCSVCGDELRGKNQTLSRDVVQSKINALNKNIIIVGEYTHTFAKTNFACAYNHIWTTKPNNILNGEGCPYCAGKKVWVGFNDLNTTRPDIAKLLKYVSDGYEYTKGSHKRATFVCPHCGFEHNKVIKDVCQYGFSCPRCSDGVSYPNKFSRAFLDQLPIHSYRCEYNPEWAKQYFYDNYFEYNGNQYILEMDGILHYKESKLTKMSLQEIQNIDIIKTNLAEQHGIHIIRVNCAYSDFDYIKTNILSSELNNIFDLSKIDWELCNKIAQRSMVKKSCDLYVYSGMSINDIANILHISQSTVRRYLIKGTECGWCDYQHKKCNIEKN